MVYINITTLIYLYFLIIRISPVFQGKLMKKIGTTGNLNKLLWALARRKITMIQEQKVNDIPYSKLVKMSNSELLKLISDSKNINSSEASRELFSRLLKRINELEKEVILLSGQTTDRKVRKRKIYYYEDVELTDELLVEYIDGEAFTIYELEKKVGAKKNVLRNRYKQAKRRLQALKIQDNL